MQTILQSQIFTTGGISPHGGNVLLSAVVASPASPTNHGLEPKVVTSNIKVASGLKPRQVEAKEPRQGEAEEPRPGEAEEPRQGEGEGDDSQKVSVHCACSGNCGRRVCKRQENARRQCDALQVICIGLVKPGHRYCLACECEIESCERPRHKFTGRWCISHGRELGVCPKAFGRRKLSKRLGLNFQIVHRLSCILRFLVPDDLGAFVQLARLTSPTTATALLPHHWVWMFLGHTIQWPPSMRHWIEVLTEHQPSTPGLIVSAYAGVVRWSSGHTWPTAFRRMESGGQDSS